MIRQELTLRSHHYVVLVLGEALLLSSFLFIRQESLQTLLAITVGVFYFFWGLFTHQGEVKTLRLMLEYAFVGILAVVMLLSLLHAI